MSERDVILEDPFVGRTEELSRLKTTLDNAVSGNGSLALIAGEPGIGKSRLADELEEYAGELGVVTYWGRCYEGTGAPVFWPWVQVLRKLVQNCDIESLEIDDCLRASAVMEIVPEIKQRLPGLKPAIPIDDADSARFRLYDSVNLLLQEVSAQQPILIVLDDLHTCDGPSLLLLELLAHDIRSARMLVVGIYRDTDVVRAHQLSKSLPEFRRSHRFLHLRLKGLKEAEARTLIERLAGRKPNEELQEDVVNLTDGNPFFIRELVELLREQAATGEFHLHHQQLHAIGIPEGIRDVLGKRLNRLRDECNDLLLRAAIVGNEFSTKLLGMLLPEIDEDVLVDRIEEAQNAGIVKETEDPEIYRFSHSLIRETLVGELSVNRRIREHAKVCRVLEQLYGDSAPDHAAELVEHAVKAETIIGEEKAVHYCLEAGNEALRKCAYEKAHEYFRQGLEIRIGEDIQTAELYFGYGKAQACMRSEVWEQSETTMAKAFSLYEKLKNRQGMIAVATHPIGPYFSATIAETALQFVEPDSSEEALLRIQNGLHGYNRSRDYAASASQFQRALEIAEKKRDKRLKMKVLSQRAWLEWYAIHFLEAEKISKEAVDLASEIDDPYSMVNARIIAANMSGMMNPRDAISQHKITLGFAEELRDRKYVVVVLQQIAKHYDHAGEWDEALHYLQKGMDADPNFTLFICYRILIALRLGNMEEALSCKSLLPDEFNDAMLVHLPEFIYYGLPGIDIDEYISNAEDRLSKITRNAIRFYGLLAVAFSKALRGDPSGVSVYYSEIMSHPHVIHPHNRFVLGICAHAMGEKDAAIEHFEIARDSFLKSDRDPFLAYTCYECASTLLDRDKSDDNSKAREFLSEGLGIAQKIRMKPLEAKIEKTLLEIDKRRPPGARREDGLTAREIEILKFIAKGFSNPDIARMLSISDRTVRNHASSIYEKTSTANRAEAASYATRCGLV